MAETLGYRLGLANPGRWPQIALSVCAGLQQLRGRKLEERAGPMQIGLLLILVAWPLIEIALLVKLGQAAGFWPTMAWVLATGIAGVMIMRRTGFSVLRTLMLREPASDRAQAGVLIDGALRLMAGGLLVLPGMIGDALGLVLLASPTRRLIAARLLDKVRIRTYRTRPHDGPDGGAPPGQVIEGDFRRIDERTIDPKR
jgi:UPF0716 protein FxsA